MTRLFPIWFCCFLLLANGGPVFAQKEAQPTAPPQARSNDGIQANTYVGPDERLFAVMAALTVAGFEDESPGAAPNPWRKLLRDEIKVSDPQLVSRMQAFYRTSLQTSRDRESAATPFLALAFAIGAAPKFEAPKNREFLPDDVNQVVGFAPLVAEFYAKSNLKELIPKFAPAYNQNAEALKETASTQFVEVLSLLHTIPVLTLPNDPVPLSRTAGAVSQSDTKNKGSKDGLQLPQPNLPPRVRRLFLITDLLGPSGRIYTRNDVLNGADTQTVRRAGDDYLMIVGPTTNTPVTALRLVVLRFVLEPIVAKAGTRISLRRPEISDLLAAVLKTDPKDEKGPRFNVFETVRESMIRAAEARLRLQKAMADNHPVAPKLVTQFQEDALFDVGTAYDRGAVLAYHFFEQLDILEKVGIDISEQFPKMLDSIDFTHEKKRAEETVALRERVKKRRAEAPPVTAPDTSIRARLAQADTLLGSRRFNEAKPLLEGILKEDPQNARAAFGLAQILNNVPTQAELDDKTEEGDKISAQEERLAAAVEQYRIAIKLATPEEKWLVSQAYVLIGHIYDFANLRDAAIEAYNQALALGDVPAGAYKEALTGKEKPFKTN
ncbi:MAG: hypothetical protein K1Y36_26040 [Blastocatellia bacterium]|nr:hypothetical protein [Blastocatellia bacterium]